MENEAPLDMTNGADQALLRRALEERWPIPPERRKLYMQRLDAVLHKAESDRDILRAIRTAALLDRLNLEWSQHEDKAKRLDEGRPTDITLIVSFDSPRGEDGDGPAGPAEPVPEAA